MAGELILIVEDNDKSRKLVRDVLTFKRYEVIESETAEEGIRLALARCPSLVLMDIRLPGIDGVEALRRLRAEGPTRGIPVMAMTASVMTEDRQKILEAGFDAYQSKPLNVTDFVAAVEQLLERHRP
jgi:two-component system, cell cycle response regulator DivK